MDVVIIKPGDQRRIYGELSSFELTAIEPPLWSALLAGCLRAQGYAVSLLDAEVEGWSPEQAAEQVAVLRPTLTVVSVSGSNPSASTMGMTAAGQLLQSLRNREPSLKIILHGLHPSALPERSLREDPVDFVCEGEGFYTLPALLEVLRAKQSAFESVPGLWYWQNGEARKTQAAPLFASLDELPLPAWDLLPMLRYRAHNWHCLDCLDQRQPYGVVYSSLGCPYSCSFCCINAIFGKPGIRYLSAELVVAQVDFLVQNYGVRNIKIIDELFGINEERVVDICDRLIERKYDLNCWAYARVNTVTPLMLDKMRQAGIRWIAYGFESGNARVLKDVNKRYDLETTDRIVEMTRSSGLYILANYIVGLPEDDFDSMQDTLNQAFHINAEWLNIYAATAYPGSALYKEACDRGWALPENWAAYSPYAFDAIPLPTRHLNAKQVLAFRDYAFHAYHENPRYLERIQSVFGNAAARHIKQMSAHRLKRKYAEQYGDYECN
ncbi:MAG: radical SAM protein [Kiritimatiellales bacterium]